MANHEQLLRMATSMATQFLADRGDDILDDRSFDDLISSFYGLIEYDEDRFLFE